jgi:hypothetical protein
VTNKESSGCLSTIVKIVVGGALAILVLRIYGVTCEPDPTPRYYAPPPPDDGDSFYDYIP